MDRDSARTLNWILVIVIAAAIVYALFFKCHKEGFLVDSAHGRAGISDDGYCCSGGCPSDVKSGYLAGDYRGYLHSKKCGQ